MNARSIPVLRVLLAAPLLLGDPLSVYAEEPATPIQTTLNFTTVSGFVDTHSTWSPTAFAPGSIVRIEINRNGIQVAPSQFNLVPLEIDLDRRRNNRSLFYATWNTPVAEAVQTALHMPPSTAEAYLRSQLALPADRMFASFIASKPYVLPQTSIGARGSLRAVDYGIHSTGGAGGLLTTIFRPGDPYSGYDRLMLAPTAGGPQPPPARYGAGTLTIGVSTTNAGGSPTTGVTGVRNVLTLGGGLGTVGPPRALITNSPPSAGGTLILGGQGLGVSNSIPVGSGTLVIGAGVRNSSVTLIRLSVSNSVPTPILLNPTPIFPTQLVGGASATLEPGIVNGSGSSRILSFSVSSSRSGVRLSTDFQPLIETRPPFDTNRLVLHSGFMSSSNLVVVPGGISLTANIRVGYQPDRLPFTIRSASTDILSPGLDAQTVLMEIQRQNPGSDLQLPPFPGVTLNGATVPEPSTWGLMTLGGAAIWIARRRRA